MGGPETVLFGIAADAFFRPAAVHADAVTQAITLCTQPDSPHTLRTMAAEVLQSLLETPVAQDALDALTSALSRPDLPAEAVAAALPVLEHAAIWTRHLLDLDALVQLMECEHLAPYRRRLMDRAIVPCVFAMSQPVPPDLLVRLQPDHSDDYFLYAIAAWRQFPPGIRDWAAVQLAGRFAWHAEAVRRLGRGPCRILAIQNIHDAQGDEIVRCVALLQAFLDFNPELRITLLTARPYLYSHPRLTSEPIRDADCVNRVLAEHYEGVINFFEPGIRKLNYNLLIENAVADYVQAHQPFLFASSTKSYNHFLFERVELDSRPIAEALGLNARRTPNNYHTTIRLIAELGLPLRCGEDPPASEFVMAGIEWPEARAAWDSLLRGNTSGRPVALLNPFGGGDPLKGFVKQSFNTLMAELQGLLSEGYFVVVCPNGTEWGRTAHAEAVITRLSPDQRTNVAIAPDHAAAPDTIRTGIPGAPALREGDVWMRQSIYFIRFADLTVTVEGWMMHAVWSLGKPYRLLMMPFSEPEWRPWTETRRQARESRNIFAGETDEGPLLPAQPRKATLLFLLREMDNARYPRTEALRGRALSSPDREIRRAAAASQAGIPGHTAEQNLIELLQDSCARVRAVAAQGLLDRSAAPNFSREHLLSVALIGADKPDWAAIVRLAEHARPALSASLQDPDLVLRREAAQVLMMLDFEARKKPRLQPALQPQPKPREANRMVRWIRRRLTPAPQLSPARGSGEERVLILTPVKDAARFLPGYCSLLDRLTYPRKQLSIGFLEGDSRDTTFQDLSPYVQQFSRRYRRAGLWKKDFGFVLPPGVHRGAAEIQTARRTVMARCRNHLLFHALDDEDWVLWLDVDLVDYPPDIIERLIATGKDIVQPHCVLDHHGPTFDRNGWRDKGRLHLDDLRTEGEIVPLDAVGGTMLLVRADLHRDGLVFPCFPYGEPNPRIRPERGELETEGLGIMALDMGHQPWGLPHVEIRHLRW